MKILSFAWCDYNTAVGNANRSFLEELSKKGHEIKVIAPYYFNQEENTFKIYFVKNEIKFKEKIELRLSKIIRYDFVDILYRINARLMANKILSTWCPDIIYSRSNPISTVWVGTDIASKYNLPHIASFSDPIPSPFYPKWIFDLRKKKIKMILKKLSAYSFICQEMLEWENSNCKIDKNTKGFILPNPINKKINIEKSGQQVISFIGHFYGKRKAENLIKGFDFLLRKFPNAQLWIVGTDVSKISPFLESNNLRNHVKILPYTNDVIQIMKESTVLVDVDFDCEKEKNVYISSKLIEYLRTNLPIVLLTTPNSPAESLLSKCSESAKIVYHKNILGIASALEWALNFFDTEKARIEREQLYKAYCMNTQINLLEDKLISMISNDK